jgi:hypothetical protein
MTTTVSVQRVGDKFVVSKTDQAGTSVKEVHLDMLSDMTTAILTEGTMPAASVLVKSER